MLPQQPYRYLPRFLRPEFELSVAAEIAEYEGRPLLEVVTSWDHCVSCQHSSPEWQAPVGDAKAKHFILVKSSDSFPSVGLKSNTLSQFLTAEAIAPDDYIMAATHHCALHGTKIDHTIASGCSLWLNLLFQAASNVDTLVIVGKEAAEALFPMEEEMYLQSVPQAEAWYGARQLNVRLRPSYLNRRRGG